MHSKLGDYGGRQHNRRPFWQVVQVQHWHHLRLTSTTADIYHAETNPDNAVIPAGVMLVVDRQWLAG